jgi:hypothetical protein
VRRLNEAPVADIRDVAAGSAFRLAAVGGGAARAYNQEAFHYFLALERHRAERSNRPLTLVLASVTPRLAVHRINDWASAQKLLTGLWLCTRDADFIGWYREGRVAAAVLTQRSPTAPSNMTRHIRTRVTESVRAQLPKSLRQTLRVHVFQLMPKAGGAAREARRGTFTP